jgi:hypothetical protein
MKVENSYICLSVYAHRNSKINKKIVSQMSSLTLSTKFYKKNANYEKIQDNENRETEPCVYNRLSPNLNKSRTSVEMAISERCKVVQIFHIRPHIAMQHLKRFG